MGCNPSTPLWTIWLEWQGCWIPAGFVVWSTPNENYGSHSSGRSIPSPSKLCRPWSRWIYGGSWWRISTSRSCRVEPSGRRSGTTYRVRRQSCPPNSDRCGVGSVNFYFCAPIDSWDRMGRPSILGTKNPRSGLVSRRCWCRATSVGDWIAANLMHASWSTRSRWIGSTSCSTSYWTPPSYPCTPCSTCIRSRGTPRTCWASYRTKSL